MKGELYVDRQYLEQLAKDESLCKDENGKSESIVELIQAGIKERSKFLLLLN